MSKYESIDDAPISEGDEDADGVDGGELLDDVRDGVDVGDDMVQSESRSCEETSNSCED